MEVTSQLWNRVSGPGAAPDRSPFLGPFIGKEDAMAHLWLTDDSDGWAILPLLRDAYLLHARPPTPIGACEADLDALATRDGRGPRVPAVLVRSGANHSSWILLTAGARSARVNGLPVSAGIRALADRDEIAINGRPPMFFSTETLAHVAPFAGSAQPLFCPRCKQQLENGVVAVRCPRCDVWHHQADDLPCWTYADTCAVCDCRTPLEASYTWVPEER